MDKVAEEEYQSDTSSNENNINIEDFLEKNKYNGKEYNINITTNKNTKNN